MERQCLPRNAVLVMNVSTWRKMRKMSDICCVCVNQALCCRLLSFARLLASWDAGQLPALISCQHLSMLLGRSAPSHCHCLSCCCCCCCWRRLFAVMVAVMAMMSLIPRSAALDMLSTPLDSQRSSKCQRGYHCCCWKTRPDEWKCRTLRAKKQKAVYS